ncbi:hypothetical protein ACQKIE_00625 [Luteibacter sp. NPDC031894]|uniref:hypothetical protein n=1 Tax=Luteibacter sp. NPDC031894 TaxID=3390572 RepID=UPI003D0812FB
MTLILRIGCACIATLLAPAWAQAQATNPYARPTPSTTSAMQDKGKKMDELESFATDGARVLESKSGDLAGDGRQGTVVVLDPRKTGNEKLGEGPGRTVLLLMRDQSGQLRKVASNDRIVPCSTCGGIAGDPFGYTRILAPGQFLIATGGGSRERWSDEYTFTWSTARKDWLISRVVRQSSDSETGKEKQVDLTAKDLGDVSFKDFDPSRLPEVTLP